MSIILLRGFSNSGKDFVGNILCKDYDYKRYAFADSLKSIIAETYGCDINLLHTQEGKLKICETDNLKRTYRQILIDEAFRLRYINPDIFANHCCNEIYGPNPEDIPEKIVITDWRYQNELDVLKYNFPDYEIIPVHVHREGQIKSVVNDISEYNLNDRKDDYVIINNMDASIYKEVDRLIQYTML
jgi:hypothetical protein